MAAARRINSRRRGQGTPGSMRVGSAVIDRPIHELIDSRLMFDGGRVMRRRLKAGQAVPGAPVLNGHHRLRRTKRRGRVIRYIRGKEPKKPLIAI